MTPRELRELTKEEVAHGEDELRGEEGLLEDFARNLIFTLCQTEQRLAESEKESERWHTEMLEVSRQLSDSQAEVERLKKELGVNRIVRALEASERGINSISLEDVTALHTQLEQAYGAIWRKVYLEEHFPPELMKTVLAHLDLLLLQRV